MRQIGTLPDELQARQFEDYLLVRGIRARVDPDGDGWEVWVIDEDHLDLARDELDAFVENPEAERFRGHTAAARQARQEEEKANREYRRRQVDVRRRWAGAGAGPAARAIPVTWLFIAISSAISLITEFGRSHLEFFYTFTFFNVETVSPDSPLPYWEGILSGEIWRLFTTMFIHFSPMHLLFNMLWLHRLGGQMESRMGAYRFLLLALLLEASSAILQYGWDWSRRDLFDPLGRPTTMGGMSGVVYGLFGFIWMKVRFEPREAYQLSQSDVMLFMIWLFACMTGYLGPVANAAHVGGLLAGIAAGYWKTYRSSLRG